MLRTDTLALLLLQRLTSLGPCSEQEAVDVLNDRAPGRGHEVIARAQQRGMIRRVERAGTVAIEAAGWPAGSGPQPPVRARAGAPLPPSEARGGVPGPPRAQIALFAF
jgi:hypothetical protein